MSINVSKDEAIIDATFLKSSETVKKSSKTLSKNDYKSLTSLLNVPKNTTTELVTLSKTTQTIQNKTLLTK